MFVIVQIYRLPSLQIIEEKNQFKWEVAQASEAYPLFLYFPCY